MLTKNWCDAVPLAYGSANVEASYAERLLGAASRREELAGYAGAKPDTWAIVRAEIAIAMKLLLGETC
ncbi:hypothetical protein [Nostoc sp. JL33]|uniref:hypothetical protein n=1 Tax=Nostoc sp. JL33 TaxID=2815396 RepID=UPI0025F034A8|nr:hypothetical protein [Nostoc sp. JL33]MBN3872278.1 hypothetical protein [Nostoc sp. JL33]